MHIHKHIYIYIYIYININMKIHICIYIHKHTQCMNTYAYSRTSTYIWTYICIYIHAYIYTLKCIYRSSYLGGSIEFIISSSFDNPSAEAFTPVALGSIPTNKGASCFIRESGGVTPSSAILLFFVCYFLFIRIDVSSK
jgi:hypothetical protein